MESPFERIEHCPEDQLERKGTYETRDWHENVLHIYPRTFNEERPEDDEHRGIGSILGITTRLDALSQAGVTAIWLGPIYDSPGLDGDYDITNYYQVNPDLGTMQDVEQLLHEAHARDMRVIFDLVPNHTSDQSEWFRASCDPSHPEHELYKDYYIWRCAVKGELPHNIVGEDRLAGLPSGYTVPNNWTSIFSTPQINKVREQYGGEIPSDAEIPAVTAWVWHSGRRQFYLAEFMRQQPSLNWSNPTVRDEIKDVVRFWLGKGVDSFRVDVINHIGKDTNLRDEAPAPIGTEIGQYNPGVTNPHDQWRQEKMVSHWPELGRYAEELLSVLREPPYQNKNIRMVFEDWMAALSDDPRLDTLSPDKANVFNFEMLLNTDRQHWDAQRIGKIVLRYYERMQRLPGVVPNQVSGNHDVDTLRTRLGSAATARAAHLMLAALPGALYTWQGDLLGRPNTLMPKERQRDKDIGQRDGERTPMQWDATVNGGFSRADPSKLWLPAVDATIYESDNFELQARDPNSPLRFVTAALRRRAKDMALRRGAVRILHTDNPEVLAFARPDPTDSRRQVISATNFSQNTTEVTIIDAYQTRGQISLATSPQPSPELSLERPILLPPDTSMLIDSQ